jgi:hypothetical protein
MLRITTSPENGNVPCIRLEGKLLQPWVDEVRGLFAAADADPLPRLDLSGVTFVDAAGTELLRELLRRGARIESCAPYVAELLHLERNQKR